MHWKILLSQILVLRRPFCFIVYLLPFFRFFFSLCIYYTYLTIASYNIIIIFPIATYYCHVFMIIINIKNNAKFISVALIRVCFTKRLFVSLDDKFHKVEVLHR